METKPRLVNVTRAEEEIMFALKGSLEIPHLYYGLNGIVWADATELAAWRTARSQHNTGAAK
jgi:hypothetical protein